MPRVNRGYKKGEPFRDARLFIISCEGAKREKEYFDELAKKSRRIKIKTIAPLDKEHGKSAPQYVMERAAEYEKEFGLSDFDQVWLVIDTDRWKTETIVEIGQICLETAKWNIAISNPCFEVWIINHFKDLGKALRKNCKELKTELGSITKGGYNVDEIMPLIADAIKRSERDDTNKDYFIPNPMETKVYRLLNEINIF